MAATGKLWSHAGTKLNMKFQQSSMRQQLVNIAFIFIDRDIC